MKLNQKIFMRALIPILTSAVAIISYCQLEVGAHNLVLQAPLFILLNVGTIYIINAALYLLSRRWWIACLISGTFWTILSIANYWVIKYRGLPISTQDLYSLTTALEVSSSYKLTMSIGILLCIFGYLCILVILFFLFRLEKGKKTSWKRLGMQLLVYTLFSGLFLYKGYFAKNPIKPKYTVDWEWTKGYYKYGYLAASVEVLLASLTPIAAPDGYSVETVEKISENLHIADNTNLEGNTPDVVLILNETLYDLSLITDIKTDIPYMETINNMKNVVRGYTLSVNTGGGTNVSEYELLTSNSMKLMPGITPFNSLKLEEANSIVSYLGNMGYETMGLHGSTGSNYSRARVYPELGFDHIRFIDDFTDVVNYGNRSVNDECLYENMHEVEQEMDAARPHFLYGLTMQNHGGWEENDSSLDTVHVQNDYGNYNDILNEFLSSIRLSDIAFKNLTDYYSNVDRPTIICMMGDHAPSFATDIADKSLTGIEKEIKLRSTPFIIWANFPIKAQDVGSMSMIYSIPVMLETAGIKLSPYYQYMLNMKNQVPIVTSFGSYLDKNGDEYQYTDETPYKELLDQYFFMEYNNASAKGGRVEDLFVP